MDEAYAQTLRNNYSDLAQMSTEQIQQWAMSTPEQSDRVEYALQGMAGGGGGVSAPNVSAPAAYPGFSWDEGTARAAAEAQYGPYYKEILDLLTQEVATGRKRGEQDYTKTLSDLQEARGTWETAESRGFQRAYEATLQQLARGNLVFGGKMGGAVRELGEERGEGIRAYGQQQASQQAGAKMGYERTLEDLAQREKLRTTEIEREKKTAIESGVIQRKGEAYNEYLNKRQQYYGDWNYGY